MEEYSVVLFSGHVIWYKSLVVVFVVLVHECYRRTWMASGGGGVVIQLRKILRRVGVWRVLEGATVGDNEVGYCYVEDLIWIGERGVCGT